MRRKTIIGIMGPGKGASDKDKSTAKMLGALVAKEGWLVLTGGRNVGVMEAAGKGCKEAGGLVVGILPDDHYQQTSEFVDIPILTGMGSSRNNINVLSCDVVIACGMGAGTSSEVSLALKAGKYVCLIEQDEETISFFKKLGIDQVKNFDQPEDVIAWIRGRLHSSGAS